MQPIHEKGLPSEPRLLPLYRENSAYCLASCLVSYHLVSQEVKVSAISTFLLFRGSDLQFTSDIIMFAS